MKNKIDSLRDHLFATLEALSDTENPMDIDRARAIADVARVVVDSAKAEVEFMKVTGARNGTGFIPTSDLPPAPAAAPRLVTGHQAESTPLRVCDHCMKRTRQDPCEHCAKAWKRTAA